MIKNNLKLIKNFSSLTILQISDYIFPLITFPYLVRVLGVENFGTANFAFAFITYFTAFTEYGFRFSATREIAVFKNNIKQLENIFNSTVIIKSILCMISFAVFLLIILNFQTFSGNLPIFLTAFLFAAGSVFYPYWFFQGIEKMHFLYRVTIPLRIISTAAIFVFVTSGDNLFEYVLIISSYQFISGLILYITAKNYFNIKFVLPSKYHFLRQLKKGYHIFLSQISINIYTSSNVFILGLLSGGLSVGYYTGANKIKEAVSGIFLNMGTAVFPHFSELLLNNRRAGIKSLKKYLMIASIISVLSGFIFFIYPAEIILFVLGDQYLNSINVMRILAFIPFIIVISNVFGIQLMLNTGLAKEFNRIISAAAFLNMILMFLLVPPLREQGAALSMLLAELFVTITMGILVTKRKLLYEI
ncbi:MAG: flippase [Bacteroidetes bacterium]|nr:flippase [Bacteroidota bacterium]